MRGNKKVLAELPRLQVMALSALYMAPLTLVGVPGFLSSTPPPFNIVISNVPGLAEPMYYGGARLDGSYPLSTLPDGQALNITLVNNARQPRLRAGRLPSQRAAPAAAARAPGIVAEGSGERRRSLNSDAQAQRGCARVPDP